MKSSKAILNILSVVCFIYGALYLFSLVFIPIAIYCFLAGRRFSYKAEHPYDLNYISNKNFRNYVIFTCIFCFPFGLLSIIPYVYLASNNVKVTDENYDEGEKYIITDSEPQEVFKHDTTEVEADVPETDAEKQEKFEKLKKFHEKGIITDDELELAKEQLFGKDNNK